MIDERAAEPAVAEDRAALGPDVVGGAEPAGCLEVKLPKGLQKEVLLLGEKL